MIQLDKRGTEITDATGQIVGYNTQAVLKPNYFFLDPNIVCDWDNNTCELDGEVFYLDKTSVQSSTGRTFPTQNEWLSTYGNTIKYDFYTFIDSKNNPSGNTKNIYRARYVDSKQRIKYILEYSWGPDDQCVSIKSIAPEGAEGTIEKEIKTLRRNSQGAWIEPPLTAVQGETITLAKLDDKPSQGLKFLEWQYDNGLSLPYNENNVQYIVMDKDYDIKALWSKEVKFVSWSKGAIVDTLLRLSGDFVRLEDLPEMTDDENQYFVTWIYDNGSAVEFPVRLGENDVNVYAKWEDWLHVNIISQDGQSLVYPNEGKIRYGQTISFDALNALLNGIYEYQDSEDPSKTWTFQGWFLGVDGEPTEQITEDVTDVQADTEIIAAWVLA